MASLQIHQDQENQMISNDRNLRSKATISNNGRSVLGVISNNSRLPVRAKNAGKPINNVVAKSKSTFTIHQSTTITGNTKVSVAAETKSSAFAICQDVSKANENSRKTVSSTVTSNQLLGSKLTTNVLPERREAKLPEKKVGLSTDLAAAVFQQRQPLKDLKIVDDEEPMSEGSFAESSDMSPMMIDKSLTITPSSPQVQPPRRQKDGSPSIFDMDEYREDIYEYLKKSEVRQRPISGYMQRQPDVTYSMRAVLVDWLVEVAEEYKLHTETLYLAVSFIDRFLSVMSVVRAKLQLLGTAAMFIASKYEEIYPPEVSEFVYITDDTYTKKQVLRMEHLILKVLKFDVSVPTILSFLTHFKVECNLSEKNLHLAMYLCELSLLESDPYLQYLPSLVACAAIASARHCLQCSEVWPSELARASGYKLEQLSDCISHFNKTHSKAKSLQQQAVFDKYKVNKLHNVSEIEYRQLVVEPATP